MTTVAAHRTPRRRARLLAGLAALYSAVLLVLVGPAVLAQEAEEPPPLTIRKVDATDPEAVQVDFIWNGERDALEDLTIRENGKEVKHEPVVPLSSLGVETAMVFVIDTSQSMGRNGGVEATQDTLRRMIDEMEGGERIGIVTFDSDVEVHAPLTTDKEELLDAVDDIVAPADGGTAMWDGVRKGASLFKPESALQPNMVLITDGYDDSSESAQSDAASALTRAKAPVFALAYNQRKHVDVESLDALVTEVGGAVISAPGQEDLTAGLEEVERNLANQYAVTFASSGEQGTSELEVSVGDESVTQNLVTGAVAEGGAALEPPEVSTSIVPGFLRGDVGLVIVVAAGGIAVALAAVAIVMVASKDDQSLDKVLQQYTEPGVEGDDENDGLAQTALMQRAVAFTEDIATRQGVLVKVEKMLEQADLPLRAAEALFFYLVGGVVLTILGLVIGGLFGMLALAFLGLFVPMAVLNYLGRRRQKQFDSQLPDMLQLLSGSLRAGYSLIQGVDAVATEMDGPMGRELRRVMTEARLGRELELALEGAAERVQSKDFEWAIMAIRIQREVGGNLSELLMTVADTMVDRERLRRDVATLTAEGKMSAIILAGMPPVLGVFMYVMNPDYIGGLFEETLGNILLGVAIVSALIGFAWMKKCITIEV